MFEHDFLHLCWVFFMDSIWFLFSSPNCRMHPEPVTCLSLGDDQLILSGSSLGRITVSGYSSDQWKTTLRPTDSTGCIGFSLPIFLQV